MRLYFSHLRRLHKRMTRRKQKMESKRRGKRKSPSQKIIFEISDSDMSSEHSDNECTEPEAKIFKTEGKDFQSNVQREHSNLGNVNDNLNAKLTENQEDNADDSVVIVENVTESHISVIDVSDTNISVIDVSDSTQDKLEIIENSDTEDEKIILDVTKSYSTESIIKISDNTCNLEEGELEETINEPEVSQNVAEDEVDSVKVDLSTKQVDNTKVELCKDQKDSIKANSCICITFSDENIAEIYKLKFLKFIQTFVELEVESYEGLSINVNRDTILDPTEWVVLDETMCLSEVKECREEDLATPLPPSPEKTPLKKKKKKKAKKEKDLFILDTNPSVNQSNELCMKYSTKFQIDINDKNTNEEIKVSSQTCFNCDSSHALKDCPHPKDFGRINNARQKFKQQKQTSRYHLEEDQKYSHLAPGKISDKLREALGLRKNQLPPFIYQMRILGYPPGWLEEAKFLHSNLSMFDSEGNNVRESSLKKKQGLDPGKIIDYPGFNIPIEKGVKDEHRQYHVPPFSKDYCKENMIIFFEKQFAKQQDDLETCDMDLDSNFEDSKDKSCKDIEAKLLNPQVRDLKVIDSNMPSPSLGDLEKQKESLLAALEDNSSCNTKSDDNAYEEKLDRKKCEPTTDLEKSESTKEPQTSVPLGKTLEINIEKAEEVNSASELSPLLRGVNAVKTSTFGTPILKSSSPYSRLPNPDNFMKDVSPVINFENLPNSTGKYEQMTGVLQKVRNTLKNLQNCES